MNTFCRFLSHGYSFTTKEGKLLIKPCCWFKTAADYDQHQQARSKWNAYTTWQNDCIVCQQQEQSSGKSFRQASFDIVPSGLPDSPVALDINLDYNCNAACIMCGPNDSTTWAQQYKKHRNITLQPSFDLNLIDKVLDKIDLSNVKRIKFFGGEPLLTDTHLFVLKKLSNVSDIEVFYTTNASILPGQEILDFWSNFKTIIFEASIDGISDRFNYIRWPLSWDKITRNLHELKVAAPVNLLFRINHTLNPFNVFYYDELENWFQTDFATNRLNDPVEINCHPCWGTWDLKRTPLALREKIYLKYGDSHFLTRLLKDLQVENYDTIINFIKKWEPKRNNNWKLIFPEIVDYFD